MVIFILIPNISLKCYLFSTQLSKVLSNTKLDLNTVQDRNISEGLHDLENFQDLMKRMDKILTQDYCRNGDWKLLAEATEQLFTKFKRSSGLILLRNIIDY